jgi:hypothetical protein
MHGKLIYRIYIYIIRGTEIFHQAKQITPGEGRVGKRKQPPEFGVGAKNLKFEIMNKWRDWEMTDTDDIIRMSHNESSHESYQRGECVSLLAFSHVCVDNFTFEHSIFCSFEVEDGCGKG